MGVASKQKCRDHLRWQARRLLAKRTEARELLFDDPQDKAALTTWYNAATARIDASTERNRDQIVKEELDRVPF